MEEKIISSEIEFEQIEYNFEFLSKTCGACSSIIFVPCLTPNDFENQCDIISKKKSAATTADLKGSFFGLFLHQFFNEELLAPEWKNCKIFIFFDSQTLEIHIHVCGTLYVLEENNNNEEMEKHLSIILSSLFRVRFPLKSVLSKDGFKDAICSSNSNPPLPIGTVHEFSNSTQPLEIRSWSFPSDCVMRARKKLREVLSVEEGNQDSDEIADKRIDHEEREQSRGLKETFDYLKDLMIYEEESEERKFQMRAEWLSHFMVDACSSLPEHERWTLLFIFSPRISGSLSKVEEGDEPKCKRPRQITSCKDYVGVISLYEFFAYPKNRLRLARAIILPGFQGKGYCLKMLMKIVDWVSDRPDIAELTVEDPTVKFMCLRIAAILLIALQKGIVPQCIRELLTSENKKVVELQEENVKELLEALKINLKTPDTICKSVGKFIRFLNLMMENGWQSIDDKKLLNENLALEAVKCPFFAEFRKELKEELYINHEEELVQLTSDEEKRKRLQEMFITVMTTYVNLFNTIFTRSN
eukprot:GHVP01060927.1.p1 GENE.GHVP01060927.1~~GHVP01060927.1.p1  ORF type:complete len:528 (-),score=105.64 GHVP01060927.1:1584-3167(-)